MSRIGSPKKISVITVAALILLFAAWVSWSSVIAAKTKFMEKKVRRGLQTGLRIAERNAPRINITNNGGYYVPDVSGMETSTRYKRQKEVYGALLERVNQDNSTPLTKVSNVSVDSDVTSMADAHATVRFEVFLGITKTIHVSTHISIPHFKNKTGAEQVP